MICLPDSASATEPSIREDVAVAFCNKGVELGQLGRREQATAACNDLLARYGSATEPSIREHVAVARRLRDGRCPHNPQYGKCGGAPSRLSFWDSMCPARRASPRRPQRPTSALHTDRTAGIRR